MANKVLTVPVQWKQFYSDAIGNYLGNPGEPIIDHRTETPGLRLCDGMTPGGHPVGHREIYGIVKPTIIAPIDGATGVSLSPMVTCGPFLGIDIDGRKDTHQASTFNFYADAEKSTLLHSSGRITEGDLTAYDAQGDYVFYSSSQIYLEVEYEGESGNKVTSDLVTFSVFIAYPDQQMTKLLASDGASSNYFAQELSLSDDGLTAIMGARGNDETGSNAGAVYVFQNISGTWTEVSKLTVNHGTNNETFGSNFGYRVALSGDGLTAIIGAYHDNAKATSSGSAYIFQNISGTWTETQKLTASDGAQSDYFGCSVAISTDGHTAIIGANGNNDSGSDSGSAYIFQNISGSWSEVKKLTASDGDLNDHFGHNVTISGDGLTTIISAYRDDDLGSNSGAAYIFQNNSGIWSQERKLVVSDSDGASSDQFSHGISLSYDGCTAMIGCHRDDDMGQSSGAVYIFNNISGSWTQVDKLTVSDAAPNDFFGYRIAMSSNGLTAVISCQNDDDKGKDSGSAYLFKNISGIWAEIGKLTANDGRNYDYFGRSVDISGDGLTVLLGAYGDDDLGISSGSAYIFT